MVNAKYEVRQWSYHWKIAQSHLHNSSNTQNSLCQMVNSLRQQKNTTQILNFLLKKNQILNCILKHPLKTIYLSPGVQCQFKHNFFFFTIICTSILTYPSKKENRMRLEEQLKAQEGPTFMALHQERQRKIIKSINWEPS